jgi:hypothetical protein
MISFELERNNDTIECFEVFFFCKKIQIRAFKSYSSLNFKRFSDIFLRKQEKMKIYLIKKRKLIENNKQFFN